MPSSLKVLAVSCLLSCLASVTTALPVLDKRQGCELEPQDVNCLLPFYTDVSMNLDFDDNGLNAKKLATYNSISIENFTIASPNLNTTTHLRTFNNSKSYARLHANKHGLISAGSTDFFKIESFYFGCSLPSPSVRTEVPQACTLTVDAMCANSSSGGLENPSEMTYKYKYSPKSTGVADLAFANMKTNGKIYACYNMTLSAEAEGGKPAVLFLDQIAMTQYFANNYF